MTAASARRRSRAPGGSPGPAASAPGVSSSATKMLRSIAVLILNVHESLYRPACKRPQAATSSCGASAAALRGRMRPRARLDRCSPVRPRQRVAGRGCGPPALEAQLA